MEELKRTLSNGDKSFLELVIEEWESRCTPLLSSYKEASNIYRDESLFNSRDGIKLIKDEVVNHLDDILDLKSRLAAELEAIEALRKEIEDKESNSQLQFKLNQLEKDKQILKSKLRETKQENLAKEKDIDNLQISFEQQLADKDRDTVSRLTDMRRRCFEAEKAEQESLKKLAEISSKSCKQDQERIDQLASLTDLMGTKKKTRSSDRPTYLSMPLTVLSDNDDDVEQGIVEDHIARSQTEMCRKPPRVDNMPSNILQRTKLQSSASPPSLPWSSAIDEEDTCLNKAPVTQDIMSKSPNLRDQILFSTEDDLEKVFNKSKSERLKMAGIITSDTEDDIFSDHTGGTLSPKSSDELNVELSDSDVQDDATGKMETDQSNEKDPIIRQHHRKVDPQLSNPFERELNESKIYALFDDASKNLFDSDAVNCMANRLQEILHLINTEEQDIPSVPQPVSLIHLQELVDRLETEIHKYQTNNQLQNCASLKDLYSKELSRVEEKADEDTAPQTKHSKFKLFSRGKSKAKRSLEIITQKDQLETCKDIEKILEEKLVSCQKQFQQFTDNLSHKEKEIKDLQEQLRGKDKKLDQMNESLSSKISEIGRLNEEYEKEIVKRTEHMEEQQKIAISNLEEEHGDEMMVISTHHEKELRQAHSQHKTTLDELEEAFNIKISTLERENGLLKEKSKKLEQLVNNLGGGDQSDEIRKLEDQICTQSNWSKILTDVTNQVLKVTDSLDRKIDHCLKDQFHVILDDPSAPVEIMDGQKFSDLIYKMMTNNSSPEELDKRILIDYLSHLSNGADKLFVEVMKVLEVIKSLHDSVSQNESEVMNLESKLNIAEEERNYLAQEVDDLRKELEKSAEENSTINKELQLANSKIRTNTEELAQATLTDWCRLGDYCDYLKEKSAPHEEKENLEAENLKELDLQNRLDKSLEETKLLQNQIRDSETSQSQRAVQISELENQLRVALQQIEDKEKQLNELSEERKVERNAFQQEIDHLHDKIRYLVTNHGNNFDLDGTKNKSEQDVILEDRGLPSGDSRLVCETLSSPQSQLSMVDSMYDISEARKQTSRMYGQSPEEDLSTNMPTSSEIYSFDRSREGSTSSELMKENQKLNQLLQDRDKEIEKYKVKCQELNENRSELQCQICDQLRQIASLNNEIDKLKTSPYSHQTVQDLQFQLDEHKNALKMKSDKLDSLTEYCANLEAEGEKLKSTINSENISVEDLRKENDKLKVQLQRAAASGLLDSHQPLHNMRQERKSPSPNYADRLLQEKNEEIQQLEKRIVHLERKLEEADNTTFNLQEHRTAIGHPSDQSDDIIPSKLTPALYKTPVISERSSANDKSITAVMSAHTQTFIQSEDKSQSTSEQCELESTNHKLEKEIKQFRNQCESQSEELNELRIKANQIPILNERINNLRAEINRLMENEVQIEKSNNCALEKLRSKLESERKRLVDLENYEEEAQSLKTNLESLKLLLEQKSDELIAVKHREEDLSKQLSDMENNLILTRDKLTANTQSLQSRELNQEKEMKDLSQRLESMKTELKRVESELENEKKSRNDLERNEKLLCTEKEEINCELDRQKIVVRDLLSEKYDLLKEIKELKASLKEYSDKLRDLDSMKERNETKLEKFEYRIEQLELSESSSKTTILNQSGQIDRLNRDLKIKEENLASCQNEMNDMRRQLNHLKAIGVTDVEARKSEIRKQKNHIQQLEDNIDDLQQEISQLEKDRDSFRHKLTSLQEDYQSLCRTEKLHREEKEVAQARIQFLSSHRNTSQVRSSSVPASNHTQHDSTDYKHKGVRSSLDNFTRKSDAETDDEESIQMEEASSPPISSCIEDLLDRIHAQGVQLLTLTDLENIREPSSGFSSSMGSKRSPLLGPTVAGSLIQQELDKLEMKWLNERDALLANNEALRNLILKIDKCKSSVSDTKRQVRIRLPSDISEDDLDYDDNVGSDRLWTDWRSSLLSAVEEVIRSNRHCWLAQTEMQQARNSHALSTFTDSVKKWEAQMHHQYDILRQTDRESLLDEIKVLRKQIQNLRASRKSNTSLPSSRDIVNSGDCYYDADARLRCSELESRLHEEKLRCDQLQRQLDALLKLQDENSARAIQNWRQQTVAETKNDDEKEDQIDESLKLKRQIVHLQDQLSQADKLNEELRAQSSDLIQTVQELGESIKLSEDRCKTVHKTLESERSKHQSIQQSLEDKIQEFKRNDQQERLLYSQLERSLKQERSMFMDQMNQSEQTLEEIKARNRFLLAENEKLLQQTLADKRRLDILERTAAQLKKDNSSLRELLSIEANLPVTSNSKDFPDIQISHIPGQSDWIPKSTALMSEAVRDINSQKMEAHRDETRPAPDSAILLSTSQVMNNLKKLRENINSIRTQALSDSISTDYHQAGYNDAVDSVMQPHSSSAAALNSVVDQISTIQSFLQLNHRQSNNNHLTESASAPVRSNAGAVEEDPEESSGTVIPRSILESLMRHHTELANIVLRLTKEKEDLRCALCRLEREVARYRQVSDTVEMNDTRHITNRSDISSRSERIKSNSQRAPPNSRIENRTGLFKRTALVVLAVVRLKLLTEKRKKSRRFHSIEINGHDSKSRDNYRIEKKEQLPISQSSKRHSASKQIHNHRPAEDISTKINGQLIDRLDRLQDRLDMFQRRTGVQKSMPN